MRGTATAKEAISWQGKRGILWNVIDTRGYQINPALSRANIPSSPTVSVTGNSTTFTHKRSLTVLFNYSTTLTFRWTGVLEPLL